MNDVYYMDLVNENSIDAFMYDEWITEFIDVQYNTDYSNFNEFDELSILLDKIRTPKDFDIVELVYDIACEKYPLVKNKSILNPRFRHVNSWFVFEKVFEELLHKMASIYENEDEPTKIKELIDKLVGLFPECENLIKLQLADADNLPNEWDEAWMIPKDIIISQQYKDLFDYIQSYKL